MRLKRRGGAVDPSSARAWGRASSFNVLTIITLVVTVALSCCYLSVAVNPHSPVNPFPPPTPLAVVQPPTAPSPPTATPTPRYPPTWTPTATPTFTPTPTPLHTAYWSAEPLTTGYPIEIVEVAGPYEQIGRAFGQWYYEHRFRARPLTAEEQETARAMLDLYDDVHLGTVEQIRGIYAVYGLNLDDVSEGIPIWEDRWSLLLPGVVRTSCSVAFARPEMAVDGHARLGRNNDWSTAMPETTLIFAYPKGAYPTAIMTVGAPNFTAFDGLNNQGLALGLAAVDEAGYLPPAGPALVDFQVYRLALETSATVEEAIVLLREVPFAFSPQFGTHVLLADRSGDSAVVEFLPEGVVVSRANTPYQVMTNSHWAGPADQRTCPRYQTAVSMLRSAGDEIDTEGLMAVMSAVHSFTQWTIVYDLQDLTLTLSLPDDDFSTRYEFSLADFVARMEAQGRP